MVRKSWIILAGFAVAAATLPRPVVAAEPPDWVGGQAAIERLDALLPAVAAQHASTPTRLRQELLMDPSLLVDADGQLLYVEPTAEALGATEAASTQQADPVDTSATFTLHSKPGSPRVIYLDFDGHTVTDTAWNTRLGGACFTGPYDSDGSPGTFSQAELTAISGVWARVAEDYAPFDVDVTTADPGPDAITRSSASDTEYGTTVLIGRSTTPCPNGTTLYSSLCASGCGGIAYVGVFDRTSSHAFYQPAFVFQNGVGSGQKSVAEAASHEAGHTLGLSHDGTAASAYYRGHGSWAPIMGVGYTRPITQWSIGEYAGATQLQDDFAIMESNGASPVPDDHVEASPTPLDPSAPATGTISTRTDADHFSIDLAQRSDVTVVAAPAQTSPDLDILLTLDGPGVELAADPPSGTVTADVATGLGASIVATLEAGSYTVAIDGTGAGDPRSTGYSDYASVGRYTVSLEVIPLEPPPPVITLSVQAYRLTKGNWADLTWDGPATEYRVYRDGELLPPTLTGLEYTEVHARRTTVAVYRVCTVNAPIGCSDDVTATWSSMPCPQYTDGRCAT